MMGYLEEVERSLVGAAERHIRRRARRQRRLGRAAAVAAVLVAGIGAFAVVRSEPARASSVTVTAVHRQLIVRVVLPDATPATVVGDLRAEGLDAHKQPVPTGPSLVGALLGLQATGTGVVAQGAFAVRVPSDWDGSLVVLAGVQAQPGAPYVAPTNAFARGEPLHCEAAPGATVEQVVRAAQRRGVALRWVDAATGQALTAPAPTSRVARAVATSVSDVVVQVDVTESGEEQRCP